MPLSKHLINFIELNTSARVVMLFRTAGKFSSPQVDFYINAVKMAVYAHAANADKNVADLDAFINEQVQFLREALRKPPPPILPPRQVEEELPPPPQITKPRHINRITKAPGPESMNMQEKLEESRKPLRKILKEDCVRLGLLDQHRAGQISARLAGKKRQDAEAEIVSELRNNLHTQIRGYLRKHRGGPWTTPSLQEDLRLDIANTNSVHAVVTLTRHLLKERHQWESKAKKGLFSNLLGGKLKFKN